MGKVPKTTGSGARPAADDRDEPPAWWPQRWTDGAAWQAGHAPGSPMPRGAVMRDDTVVGVPSRTSPPPPIPPGIMYWRGRATGSWWAVVPGRGGPRLVEAISEDALAVAVDWHLRNPS